MAVTLQTGQFSWSGDVGDDGHRNYTYVTRALAATTDGPAAVIAAVNTAIPVGSTWSVDGDVDAWAWRLPGMQISPEREGEPNKLWKVSLKFSTKPPENQRCNTTPIEDPLLEPQRVSGSFIRKTEMGLKDRFGQAITNSSHEAITGPQNEWDADGGDTVSIEQNVADLELDVLAALKNCVNDAPLWGMPARCVKFNMYTWEQKFYGVCNKYYTRRLEFEVNAKTFDRDILDEGTKVLHGYWDSASPNWVVDVLYTSGTMPDPNNPAHFDRAADRQGNPIHVILDGAGKPFIPPNPITSCIQCPTGAPEKWKVTGLTHSDGTPEELTLTYVSGCTWEFDPGGGADVRTLYYDGGSSSWLFEGTEWTGQWSIADTDWECMGPNTMTRTSGLGPLTLGFANADALPGKRHVEKYQEGDLLALGIPTSF